ncbi:amidase [Conexibacter woesei]|uniref:amidase n=1 Tax=Conexibacter woesei TaxID=191495 RepID=UPI0004062E7F|nr:amidase [Conexibacter woesei]
MDLHWWTARDLVAAVARRELSAREVVAAHLERIDAVNDRVNAIVSLRPEAALREAEEADARAAAPGAVLGPLHGLPIAIKDLEDTAGIRTTYGSKAFAEHVPKRDSPLVARLRAAGAIVVGKTNTPELGAGSHTFNEVFGTTRNPYDLTRSAGGSSGGAGAALATGMLPIADGSDHGGSIRNPASFNNVVGLRPTPGLVPDPGPGGDVWDVAAVVGPLARTVGDLGLMLTAIAGPDPRDPLSHDHDAPGAFAELAPAELHGLRVAWCPDVGGLPIDPAVRAVVDEARDRFAAEGAHVEEVALDDVGAAADDAFETLRAIGFARLVFEELPDAARAQLKDTIIWNAELGRALDGPAIARAQAARGAVFRRVAKLMEDYDVLVAPAAQVVPFDAELPYPTHVDGVEMPHYLGWMRACSRLTVSAHPIAAVPGGFTPEGLPVGLQLLGRFRGDRRLLQIAAAWEAATGFGARRPQL